jgi:hypothetical protein
LRFIEEATVPLTDVECLLQFRNDRAGATPTGVNPQTDDDIQAAVAAAKVAVPTARMSLFPVSNILTGNGSVATTTGNGNSDLYLNADKTHPDIAGEVYESSIIAQRAYDCIQGI